MSLSTINVEQREKETKALRSFIAYSLIGSLALHIGLLSLVIGKFLLRDPELKDQPIEVTMIATPIQEVAKPLENRRSLSGKNSGGGGGNSNARSGIKSAQVQTATSPTISSIALVPKQTLLPTAAKFLTKQPPSPTPPKSVEKQPQKPTSQIKKVVDKSNIIVTEQSQIATIITPQTTKKTVHSPESNSQPNINPTSTLITPAFPTQPSRDVVPSSGNLLGNLSNRLKTALGNGIGNGSGNGIGNGSGNGIGNGSGNGIGNGSGNGIGNGSGNGIGNGSGNQVENKPRQENTKVATAPKPPTDNSSRLDRADCLKCEKPKYPDRARRRGVEGKPEVSVDTDANGNVTRVRLIRSSGNDELDAAAQRAAQGWKLKPSSKDRQDVRVSLNFAIEGSQRYRELKKRERRREATQKQPETAASTQNPIESPSRSQRSSTPIVTDVPKESTTSYRQEPAPASSQKEDATPLRRPRQSAKSNTPTPSQPQLDRTERVQRRQRKLEESLRRRQKPSESQASRTEEAQRRRRKLVQMLRRQQPAESPPPDATAPSSAKPADSNGDSESGN